MKRPLGRQGRGVRVQAYGVGLSKKITGLSRSVWSVCLGIGKTLALRRKRFLATFVLAALLEFLVLPFLRPYALFHSIEEAAVDWAIGLYRGVTPPGERATPFVYLDIDDETFRRWNGRFFVPRDKLGDLIQFALASSPRLLIIDVDLSFRAGAGDDAIVRALTRSEQSQPPIIMVRTFQSADIPVSRAVMPSFLEEYLLPPQIHWASFDFERGSDWKVRRWSGVALGCRDGIPWQVPAIPDVAHELLGGRIGPREGPVIPRSENPCGEGTRGSSRAARELQSDDEEGLGNRILFSLPWRLGPGEQAPLVGPTEGRRPLLTVLPAFRVTEVDQPVSGQLLAGSVVIIGGSYEEGRDLYPTPLGVLPGPLLVANAVHSLLAFGAIHEPPKLVHWLLGLPSCLFVAAVSVLVPPLLGFVCSALVVAVLAVASVLVLKEGIWLDFAMPLVAIAMHGLFDEGREEFVEVRERLVGQARGGLE